MLDMEAGLVRQAISIAVVKAMGDMKRNARRSIRNLIDLGLLFSKGENQKWFFETAKKMIDNPRNPYNLLVSRIVREVDHETLRKVGLNLGYNSLTWGAKKLRRKQEALGVGIPWILSLNAPSGPDCAPRIGRCVAEGLEMGIYSYALSLADADGLPALVETIKKYDDCFFMLRLPGALIDDAAARLTSQAHNIAVSVDLTDAEARDAGAFERLRENRCLYGYSLTYGEGDVARAASPQFVRWGIDAGCLFGVYVAADGAPQDARDQVFDFACRVRGENGQPLIALDWARDILAVGEKLRTGGSLSIDLAGKAFWGCREAMNPLGALAELLLLRAKVCPV